MTVGQEVVLWSCLYGFVSLMVGLFSAVTMENRHGSASPICVYIGCRNALLWPLLGTYYLLLGIMKVPSSIVSVRDDYRRGRDLVEARKNPLPEATVVKQERAT